MKAATGIAYPKIRECRKSSPSIRVVIWPRREMVCLTGASTCGCGNKIITPIGPINWSFNEIDGKPTLCPSLGNWQLPCRSHYWITKGVIEWSYQWSDEQIEVGRKAEEKRRKSYYNKLNHKRRKQSIIFRIVNWFFRK
jgi:hypothetical protein